MAYFEFTVSDYESILEELEKVDNLLEDHIDEYNSMIAEVDSKGKSAEQLIRSLDQQRRNYIATEEFVEECIYKVKRLLDIPEIFMKVIFSYNLVM